MTLLAEAGTAALTFALAGTVAGIATTLLGLHTGRTQAHHLARRAHAAALVAIGAAFALYVYAFVAARVGLKYVWQFTRTDEILMYRLAGVWGGQEGTVLLWTTLTAGFLALASLRKARLGDAYDAWFSVTGHAVVAALLGFSLVDGAFETTDPGVLFSRPNGNGLQDVLRTPFMVIHPPLQFVTYALTTLLFAAAFAHWVTGRRDHLRDLLHWGRPAWLFSTLGLGMGAIWAYYVLSFGGFWAWDPVETANLIPWLALTALLHALKPARRFGDFPLAVPLLGALSFILSVFATFATRSGWWVSVHAFTDPTNKFNPDAAGRLLAILDASLPAAFFGGLLLVASLVTAALIVRHDALRNGAYPLLRRAWAGGLLVLAGLTAVEPRRMLGILFEASSVVGLGRPLLGALTLLGALLALPALVAYVGRDDAERPGGNLLTQRGALAAAVVLLGLATAVTLLLDFMVVDGRSQAVFESRAPFVAVPLVVALTFGLLVGRVGSQRALFASAAVLLAGAIGAALSPDRRLLGLGVGLLSLAALFAAWKLYSVHARAATSGRDQLAGGFILASALLGGLMWANPPTELPFLGWETTVAHALIGVVLAVVGLLGGAAALRGYGRAPAVAGGLAGALAIGYGAGLLLGLAGAVLAATREGPARKAGRAAWGNTVRQTGVYLIHLALLVGLLGYVMGTYGDARALVQEMPPGDQGQLDGLTYALGEPAFHPDGPAIPHAVEIPMTLTWKGDPVPASSLHMEWGIHDQPHYDQHLSVIRTLGRDVYINPIAFKDPVNGWIEAQGQDTRFTGTGIEAVAFEIFVIPGMHFLWFGLWFMTTGMAMIMVGTRLARKPVTKPPLTETGDLPVERRSEGETSIDAIRVSALPAAGMTGPSDRDS